MIAAFWGAVALVLYTYAGYPLAIWLGAYLRPRHWRQAECLPGVSIVMAVFNGAPLLKKKLEHLLALEYPNLVEIISVSDGSSDETNAILRAQSHPKCKCIVLEEQSGKAVALNRGLEMATGDIVLFVDLRPWLGDQSVTRLMRNFADPGVGCVAGELIVSTGNRDAGAEAVGGLYWKYEQWIRDCEARFDSPLGVYGGFYAARRSLITALPAGTILDDMYQPLSIVRQGYRSVLDPEAKVYDNWPNASADEFRRKVRTLAGNFQLVELAPWLLGPSNRLWFQFVSHKLLRLLVPLLLVIALLSSAWMAVVARSTFFQAITLLQLAFYAAALLGGRLNFAPARKLAGVAHAFCMLNLAVVVGFYQYLFSPRPLWKSLWSKTHIAPQARIKAEAAGGN
ncbi:MAG: glycosyltransferase [Acidobacteriaceae bacterium]